MRTTSLRFNGAEHKLCVMSPESSRAQSMVECYRLCKYGSSITQAYDSPSPDKIEAWSDCVRLMGEFGGHGMRITGRNSYQFSCAFKAKDDNGDRWLIYITRTAHYAIMI